MATFTVTNLGDSGTGSLRDAIVNADAADAAGGTSTIAFDPNLKGGTLTLTSGELDITASGITIDGEIDGTDIAIDGNRAGRVFSVDGGTATHTISATLNGLVIQNGYGGGKNGGGIYVGASDVLALTNSVVSGNGTVGNGGGIYGAANAIIALNDVTLSGNEVAFDGGGIYGSGALIGLTNCTVYGNFSDSEGGGIFAGPQSLVTLTNTTVSGNSAIAGGGIFDAGSYTRLTNSIVAGNLGSGGGDDLVGGSVAGNYYSLTFTGGNIIGSATLGFATVSGPPPVLIDGTSPSALGTVFASVGTDHYTNVLSGALANNGGPVETIALKASALNPAIDAGNDALAPVTDARGFARYDFPGVAHNGPNISDLGAYEAQTPTNLVVTTLSDETYDGGSYAQEKNDGNGLSLREAIGLANAAGGSHTITFASNLAGGTLTLDQGLGLLKITDDGLTIDGDIDGDGTPDVTIDGNNTSRVFAIDGSSVVATLNGLTIQDGRANGVGVGSEGGGIYIGGNDALTLSDTAVTGNYAASDGGGLYAAAGASLTLSNDVIASNQTNGDGGGIFGGDDSTVTLTGSSVDGNSVNPEGGHGGGIFSGDKASLTLTNSTVTGNDAAAGGGIYGREDASIALTNSTVSENGAGTGGGIYGGFDASINLTGTTLAYNSAGGAGGGVFGGVGATIALTNATLAGNYAHSSGGGVYGFGNDAITLTNSTLTGNDAGATGGGISNWGYAGSTTLVNSIVAGNDAAAGGSDLYGGDTRSSLTLTGGNILGSAPSSFSPVSGSYTPIDGTSQTDLQSVFADVGYTYVGVAQTGVLSGQLGYNGGSVQTIALNASASNPAIDAGDDGLAPATDARGFARSDFPGVANNGANISDLGAFEQQAAQTFVVTTITDELDSTNPNATLADMAGGTGLSLREALFLANEDPTTADTITFAANLAGDTIDLTLGQLKIDGGVTIDGGNDNITIDAQGHSRVFDARYGTSTINGLTMTGGSAAGTYAGDGGAIQVGTSGVYGGADLTISNSTITSSYAAFGGGIAVNAGDTLQLTNSTVSSNVAAYVGGGIANEGTLTLTNATVATNSSGYIGGGIASDNTLTVIGSTLSDNQISGLGAGLLPPGYSYGGGGGLYNSGSATLLNTTIARNKSGGYSGGGVYNSEALTLTNVTIADNSAYDGGGLSNAACGCGNVAIYDTTITGNDATNSGGGIYNANGIVALTNSIVAGNGAGYQGPDIAASGTATTIYSGVNLFSQAGAGRAGTDIDVSPADLSQVFATGTLANNGGPVETVLITQGGLAEDAGDVGALPPDSDDLNTNGNTTELLPVDARGDPRVVDGTLDLGAVELQVPPTPVVTAVSSNVNATASESFTPGELFSASAPVGSPILSYEVEDESSGLSQGFWVLNGAVLTNGQLTTLTAAQLSQLSFVAGSAGAPVIDTLEVAASDSAGLGAFATFTVTASAHVSSAPPVVTAANELQAPYLTLAASSLFSATAFGGNTIVSYEVEDTTTDSGHWVFNGTVEPTNQLVLVTAAQLSELSFATGYGSDTLKVRANDGSQWGSVVSFTVTPPPNAAPPAGTEDTLVMLRNADGAYEFYDIGHNAILLDGPLGQINPALQVAGVGGFNGGDTADLLMRDPTTGVFTLYDVSNNNITGNVPLGQVGPEWTVAGFGDFSTRFGETDMLMRNSNSGAFEVYDIANNAITSAGPMGQVGLEWTVAGFGDFSGRANETDMLMRNSNNGDFELYDINNNTITSAQPMGQVGLEWQIAGFGDFSTRPGETDMLMRNSNNGVFEVYDIVNNTITSAQPMGQVGLEWSIAGFGNFSGNANETDMLMRNSNNGDFELYDIGNNTVTGTAPMGQVGLEWSISGVAASIPGAPPSSATAQLTQAMASFAPSPGTPPSSSPLDQAVAQAIAANRLTMPNHA